MKARKFKEANVVFAKEDSTYGPIPAYMDKSPAGNYDVVLCYGLSFWEKLMVLFTGRIWITFTTYDGNLNPIWLTTVKKQLLTSRKQRRDQEKKIKKVKRKLGITSPSENGQGLKAV